MYKVIRLKCRSGSYNDTTVFESLLGRKCMQGLMIVGHTVNWKWSLNVRVNTKK